MKVKTIDINAKEWLDKPNGNRYFSVRTTVNYGMKDAEQIVLPFQYGYGDQYVHEAAKSLIEKGFISLNREMQPLWQYCRDNKIILRTSKIEKCTRKDVTSFGSIPSTTDRVENFKA